MNNDTNNSIYRVRTHKLDMPGKKKMIMVMMIEMRGKWGGRALVERFRGKREVCKGGSGEWVEGVFEK